MCLNQNATLNTQGLKKQNFRTERPQINCFFFSQKILESKRSKLASQLDEAKSLKESIDRRSAAVSAFLHGYLGEEQFADYEHFVKMKVRLFGCHFAAYVNN